MLLTSTIHIWQSQSNLPPLTHLDLVVNPKTNPLHIHFNPNFIFPSIINKTSLQVPNRHTAIPQRLQTPCFIPKRSRAPSLAKNKPFGEHWIHGRIRSYRSRLTGFWLGGWAEIAFARTLYIAHPGTENHGQRAFEVLLLLLPSQPRFCASGSSIIKNPDLPIPI